jgi:copper oxidase (laccase) domain-containing protein
VKRAAVAGVEAMRRVFGSAPADLVAAIGPCLGVCCGEVGEEVVEAFRLEQHPEADIERWFSVGPGGRYHLHLARANRDQLENAGLDPANIHVADVCTRSYPDGRLAALIRPTLR